MTADLVLLPEMPYRRAFVRRMSDPEEVPDCMDVARRDAAVVLVERALGDRVKRPLGHVRRTVFDAVASESPDRSVTFVRDIAELTIASALTHWLSPVGLDFRHGDSSESLLWYRGAWYVRRKGGRLSWLEEGLYVCDMATWANNTEFARTVLKGGLLGGGPS